MHPEDFEAIEFPPGYELDNFIRVLNINQMDDLKINTASGPSTSTDLSFERTILSHERTLMSWIRTSTSMITFGFSIYKILEQVNPENSSDRVLTPRLVGMIFIFIGFIGLFLAVIQHVTSLNKIKLHYPAIPASISVYLAALVLVVGAGLFVGTWLRQ